MEYQRFVAVEKKIKEINAEKDGKVRILGTIVSKEQNSLIIDDGTGTVRVFTQTDTNQFKDKQLVRVIGRVLPNADNFDIQGEIIQNMENLDVDLYNKTEKLWGELNV
jgi:RNase P/RNase MRP subunit p29